MTVFGAFALTPGGIDEARVVAIGLLAKDRGAAGGEAIQYRAEPEKVDSPSVAVLGVWLEGEGFSPDDRAIAIDGLPECVAEACIAVGVDTPETLRRYLNGYLEASGGVRFSMAALSAGMETVFLVSYGKPLFYVSVGPAVYFSSHATDLTPVLLFGQAPVRVPPSSLLDLRSGVCLGLERNETKKTLVPAMDYSDVAAEFIRGQGREVVPCSGGGDPWDIEGLASLVQLALVNECDQLALSWHRDAAPVRQYVIDVDSAIDLAIPPGQIVRIVQPLRDIPRERARELVKELYSEPTEEVTDAP